MGWWMKQEIRWASAFEKGRGNDWCRVESYPSQDPTKELFRFSTPIFQDAPPQPLTVLTTAGGESTRPRDLGYTMLMGCIPYGGMEGERHTLFVMYRITYDANHSANFKLIDMRASDK